MSSYLYGRVPNGKTIKVQTPGGEVVAALVQYISKPHWDLWGETVKDYHRDHEKQEIRQNQKWIKNWDKMEPQKFVALKCGQDDRELHLYQWQGREPLNHFDGDSTLENDLICLGSIDEKGVLQPLVKESRKGCTLTVYWNQYIMESPTTRKHELDLAHTPSHRMWAHWAGFLESQPLQADLTHPAHPAYANKVKLKGYNYQDGLTVHQALRGKDFDHEPPCLVLGGSSATLSAEVVEAEDAESQSPR